MSSGRIVSVARIDSIPPWPNCDVEFSEYYNSDDLEASYQSRFTSSSINAGLSVEISHEIFLEFKFKYA